MPSPDPREAKLPAWARTALRIARDNEHVLRVQLAEVIAELKLHKDNGPSDSDTFLDLSEGRKPVGRGTYVTFLVRGGSKGTREVSVRVDSEGWLEVDVAGTGGLTVHPVHINSVRISG